jgi:hypothetical protein
MTIEFGHAEADRRHHAPRAAGSGGPPGQSPGGRLSMGFLRSRSDLASANGHAVEPGPRRPRDAGRAISQLGCFGTRTAGRCMGLLRRACDFATENGRATVPARRRPGGAAPRAASFAALVPAP